MTGDTTIVFGVPVPSVDPLFLAVVRFHIVVGIVCVVAGIAAMLSQKRRGRHSTFGTIYFWSLAIVAGFGDGPVGGAVGRELSTVLSRLAVLDRRDDGADSLTATLARLGQAAHRRHGPVLHPDADRILCGQRQEPAAVAGAPAMAFWVLPAGMGLPLMLYALLRHPLSSAKNAGKLRR